MKLLNESVKFMKQQEIATISFNRPESYNAFNREMAEVLREITDSLLEDGDVRVILLQGEGKAFMSGGDIHFFHERLESMKDESQEMIDLLNSIILNLQKMKVPVLAKVHGAVAGVGMSFMLATDLVVSTENCKITTAYSKLGITPDGGLSYFLPRLVGKKKAAELLLLSDAIDGIKAQKLGLVNWVFSEDKLEEETQKVLQKLSRGPSFAYSELRNLLYSSDSCTLEEQLDLERKSFQACTQTDDFHRAVKAFVGGC
ncbi:Uncharacterized protein SCG7109_AD_00410 [Chlamydiales bacterium SCGC AG-110-M15]|nr:Uncharacterized protein SCG7109_AD_00410 [Chlamydiales bacterium SCGC AG-110-M15]